MKLKSVLTGLIDEFPNLRVRDVARVSGFVIFLTLTLGPIARLFIRQMYFFIQLRHSWDDVLVAAEGVLQELKFLLMHVEAFNGTQTFLGVRLALVLTCDVRESSYGVHFFLVAKRGFVLECGVLLSVLRALLFVSYGLFT